jgi:hypothetical protein
MPSFSFAPGAAQKGLSWARSSGGASMLRRLSAPVGLALAVAELACVPIPLPSKVDVEDSATFEPAAVRPNQSAGVLRGPGSSAPGGGPPDPASQLQRRQYTFPVPDRVREDSSSADDESHLRVPEAAGSGNQACPLPLTPALSSGSRGVDLNAGAG